MNWWVLRFWTLRKSWASTATILKSRSTRRWPCARLDEMSVPDAFAPMPSASVSTATAVKPGFFSNWRNANLRSFMPQRLHRIEPGGAPRGQPTRQNCHGHEQQRGAGESPRIPRCHAVEKARNKTTCRQAPHQTNRRAEQSQIDTLADYE